MCRCGSTSATASAPYVSSSRCRNAPRAREYSWVPTCSTTYTASRQPSWAARSRSRSQLSAARKPARNASPTPVGSTLRISGTAATVIDSSPSRSMRTPSAPSVTTQVPTRDEHLVGGPAGLLGDQLGFVLVGEQDVRAVDEVADHLAVTERELLGRVGDEPVAALAALVGVPEHALRVVRPDEDVRRVPDAVDDRLELDLAGLAHRAGVEGRDLGHRRVVGAHEARGVPGLGDVHVVAVDVVPLEPRAVLAEVLPHGADEHRAQAQVAQAEADVRRAASPAYLEVLDEEGQRELVQRVDDQGVGELAREGHQVVGGDGARDQQRHVAEHYRSDPLEPLSGSTPR